MAKNGKVKFRLDGKRFERNPLTPMGRKAMTILEGLSLGDLLSTAEVITRLGCHPSAFGVFATRNEMSPFRCQPSGHRKLVWGSKRTIAALRRELNLAN